MPTFKSAKPQGIAQSIATLFGGSSAPDASTIMQVALARSKMDHEGSIAEKARAEAESIRSGDADRRDPSLQNEYAANAAGITLPMAKQYRGYQKGDLVAPDTPLDAEGKPNPIANYPRPNITPQQEQLFTSAIMSTIGNRLGTGKTNAEQLAKAGSTNLLDQARMAAAQLPGAAEQNQAMAPWRPTAREPFQQNAAGTSILNQEIGSAQTPNTPAAQVGIADVIAHTKQRNAAATASLAMAAKRQGDGSGAGAGTAASDWLNLTGTKLSALPAQQRTTWIQNHAAGMDAAENLASLKKGPGAALKDGAVKSLAAAGDAVENSTRMAETFRPEYGGKTILGDLSNTYKRLAGDETGQAQWWQDLDQLQNQTRHTLFGSALTATELAAWNKTSVTPRMDPKQIAANLERRQEIEARAASKLARGYAAGGYNQDQIKELLGAGAKYLEKEAPRTGAGGSWDGADRRQPNYGVRADGTKKGNGFLGALQRPDGDVSTELSVGVRINGKETEIPSLVPTLTKGEIDHLLKGGEPTPQIVQKAVDFAKKRIADGKSPFAGPNESPGSKATPAATGRRIVVNY